MKDFIQWKNAMKDELRSLDKRKKQFLFKLQAKKKGTTNEGSEKKSMETIDTRPY